MYTHNKDNVWYIYLHNKGTIRYVIKLAPGLNWWNDQGRSEGIGNASYGPGNDQYIFSPEISCFDLAIKQDRLREKFTELLICRIDLREGTTLVVGCYSNFIPLVFHKIP